MRGTILTALVWICVAPPASMTLATTPAPDTILFNGKIFTAERQQFVQALAIQGDRIAAVGNSEQIRKMAGSLTKLIDLRGRVVIPGLNDAHNHMRIRPANWVDLQFTGPIPRRSELMQAIREAAQKYPPGTFLAATIGTAVFRDTTVDRARLDGVAPSHPVILTTFTGHAAILNSAALTKLGIGENEADPLGGRYERTSDGKLNGVLREYATVRLSRRIGDITSDQDAISELRVTLADSAEHGITTLQIMSEKMPPGRYVDLLKQVPNSIRLRIMRMPMTSTSGRDNSEGQSIPRNPSPLITVSGTKWLLDGVPVEGTFAPRAAKPGLHFFGDLQMSLPPRELDAMLRETVQSGDQLLVHVTGYPASAAMLEAMQNSGGEQEWVPRRVRFEHGDALFPDLIPRVKRLGVIVVEQGTHLDMTEIAPELMPSVGAEKSQPMRSLLAAGIPLVLSSDEDGPSNPFLEILLATKHPNHPSEAISREEAVIAYTRTAAYAEFAEKEKGSLAPGKLADLAVLSQDIFTVPSGDLPETVSIMTIVGGKMIYDAHLLMR
jgi:predicted amidohydrolase YtcJ